MVKTENISEIIKGIDLDDLRSKEPCYFCIAFWMPLSSALHEPENMKSGPISSDAKCPHCYDTEKEFGRLRLTEEERNYASLVLNEIKQYKL